MNATNPRRHGRSVRTRRHGLAYRPTTFAVSTLAALAFLASGCTGDDTASTTTAGEGKQTTTSGHDSHQAMAPPTASASEIAKLGPGPSAGQTFKGSVGLDVCGRFLDLSPPAAVNTSTGFGLTSEGHFSVTPPTPAVAGHAATVAGLAEVLGVQLSSGTVTFAPTAGPERIDVSGNSIEVAGRTFGPAVTCGDTPAEVQLWVFPAKAVETGKGLVKVLEDPQDVPIVEDGMAFVIAVAPESSLPTLPPSALVP